MENKTNDISTQRPEGHADLVQLDLTQLILKMKQEPAWTENDRSTLAIFKSDTMKIVLLGFHKNAELKTHQANGIISVQVLEGNITFATVQKTVTLEKGQMIALFENIPHSVKALTESFILLTLAMNKQK